jgi:hypothetical protein
LQIANDTFETVVVEILLVDVNSILRMTDCLCESTAVVDQKINLIRRRNVRNRDNVHGIAEWAAGEHLGLEATVAIANDLAFSLFGQSNIDLLVNMMINEGLSISV